MNDPWKLVDMVIQRPYLFTKHHDEYPSITECTDKLTQKKYIATRYIGDDGNLKVKYEIMDLVTKFVTPIQRDIM